MGVPGLWDILNRAGKSRSLIHLAVVDGFEGNKSGTRAYRIGIDASIWYRHASYGKGGENPEVRTLFFRLKSLAELPILPLFIFDGRERPKVKRDSKLGKSGSHALAEDMRTMLNAFGIEWRTARGEAEAELAYLNQKGHIDAILTDDCDALIFGGHTLIKNLTLTGNKSNPAIDASGKASKHHVMMYTMDAIQSHPEVSVSRGGLVLIALLCGGDYHKGVEKFGKVIAHALARCGFGDQLLTACEERAVRDIHTTLAQWRTAVNVELRTNSRGFLPHRSSLSLPDKFPDLDLLDKYVYPMDSNRAGTGGGGAMRDKGELNLRRLAQFCEEKFEWGYRSAIIKRFRSLMWPAAVMRVLRRAALMADEREKTRRIKSGIHDLVIRSPLKPSPEGAVGTPSSLVKHYLAMDSSPRRSEDRYAEAFVNRGRQPQLPLIEDAPDPHPLIIKVVGVRRHVSTDRILQYRIEVSPVQLVSLASAGIKGERVEPSATSTHSTEEGFNDISDSEGPVKKPPPHPESSMRIWVPGSMLHQVHPGLVEDYAVEEEARRAKKSIKKGKVKVDDNGAQLSSAAQFRSRRCHMVNLAATDLACQSDHDNLDPSWFSSDRNGVEGPLGSTSVKSNFLFTFPDPESLSNNKHLPDDDLTDNMLVDEYAEENNWPPSRFDDLFDHVMGLSEKPPRSSKASNQKKRRENLKSKTLANLDKLEVREHGGLTKRQKTYQPFPVMPALSDSEDGPSSSLALHLASSRQTAFQPCVFPEPSSSQTNDFIDLT